MGNKHNKNVQRGLNEKEVSMLMTNTGLTRPEVEAWHKQFMTEFPSGYIDQKQFVELYKQTYTHGHPEKFAKFAFNAFDHDNSGKTSFIFVKYIFILASSFLPYLIWRKITSRKPFLPK
jgi:Ca2+-binding EF-hand superfamily protein